MTQRIAAIRAALLAQGWISPSGDFLGDPYAAYSWASANGIGADELETAATGGVTGAVNMWARAAGVAPLPNLLTSGGAPVVADPESLGVEPPMGTTPPPEVQPAGVPSKWVLIGGAALALLALGRSGRRG